MALAELHHSGGFQPQMATESGERARGGDDLGERVTGVIASLMSRQGERHWLLEISSTTCIGDKFSRKIQDPAPSAVALRFELPEWLRDNVRQQSRHARCGRQDRAGVDGPQNDPGDASLRAPCAAAPIGSRSAAVRY